MDIFRRKNSYGSLEERRSSNEASDDDKLLMAQSREQLTMDMTKSDNSIFKKPAGCYISRSKAFLLAAVFLIVAVAVGLITHNISKCSEDISRLSTGDDSSSGARKAAKVKDVRLPTNVRPLYYKLDLIPHVDPAKNFTLEGKVWIDMECLEETNKITIQIKNITIQEESVTLKEIDKAEGPVEEAHEHQHENEQENEHEDHHHHHGSFAVTQHHYDIPREFYNVTLNAKLRPGKIYRLYIQYVGELNDELAGFYRSSYKDKTTNETRWLAVTQFQPTDARRAFPCFDEPALKAKFEISIARRTQMTSISNMNLNKTVPMEGNDGWVWDHYTKSVAMSTYLVAFMVSDFEQRESDRSLSKPMFRVWARKDAINQVEYARDIGPKILTYYEQYFNVEFPLPKQDMVALPDFNAGAMENWGLITYRATAMLYDPKVSSDLNKLRIATVIAHELAHQWFGNLVTPSWWHDLWLNEGFASYVEYIGVDHVEPDWKVLEQFVCDEIQHVFSLDALDSSHPISIPVTHPDEINEIFDRISYSKGASVIRMMNHFLTEKTFKSGLTNYLIKWKYNSTKQTDLWDSLTEQAYSDKSMDSEMTVMDVMDSWTLQKGFPVIQVDRSYETSETNFTQIKFQLIKNETVAKEYESYRWWVPISYSTREYNNDFSQTKPVFWLPKTKKTVSHNVLSNKTEDWLIVNVQQTGYYRVNYDQKNWQLIMGQLNTNASEIHIINRAQLVDDAFNLARATLLSYDTAFNITQYLRDENEYLPWESFLTAFSYISQMFLKSPSYGIFKKYMQGLLEKQYQRVGFNETSSDPLLEKYHRINILQWACAVDHKDCVGNAKQLYAEWMSSSAPNTNNPVPTNLRRLIYCAAIKNGGEKEWNFAWQRYLEANVASEKNTILNALACSKQIWILNRYLNWSVTTGSQIRKQDGPTVIKAIASSDIGNYLAFNFIRDKWSHIRTYFGSGFFSVGGIVNSISQRLNTEFELRELQNFKTRFQHELGSATRTVNQAIEGVQANVQWMADNFIVITKWLEKNTNAIPVDVRIQ